MAEKLYETVLKKGHCGKADQLNHKIIIAVNKKNIKGEQLTDKILEMEHWSMKDIWF
jgi:hypothetical protein